jgi:pimeloyl-ACP methyl ester carboxylesterase
LFCWAVLGLSCSGGTGEPVPDAGTPAPDAGAPDSGVPDAGAPVVWGACDLSNWPAEYPMPPVDLECTTVDVPVDRAQPGGATMTLHVGRYKALDTSSGKAVFQLAGGPGGSAIWESGIIPRVFDRMHQKFDIIYVDQRGTGGSDYLDCSQGYPSNETQWRACGAEHTTEPLNHYLTTDAAQDIEDVRLRLGYAKMYLHGGSYGTRVGLEYARLFPQNLAAAVLDGVLPPDVDDFAHDLTISDESVARLISDCSASPGCMAASPSLQADLDARKQALTMTPRPITIQGQSYVEDVEMFEDSLYAALDWNETYYLVPRAIHQSLQGDNTQWNAVLTAVYGVTVTGASDVVHRVAPQPARLRAPHRDWHGKSYVSPGLFQAITCAEYLPNASMANLETLSTAQSWLYAPAGEVGRAKACAAWNVNAAPASVRQAVMSNARVLLMSGDIDFRTPKAWAAQAKQTLPNATHLVFPYASHEAGTVYPCAANVTADYLAADGDIAHVDTGCMQQITAPTW